MAQGIDKIPLRIPAQWDAKWFADFIKEVLALADVRNAIGEGLDISGQSSDVATLAVNADIQDLVEQSFVVAQPSGFLDNERTLAGEDGVISIVDGGPDANITVTVMANGINLGKIKQFSGYGLVGNPTNSLADMQKIAPSGDGEALAVISGELLFTLSPVWSGDHKWLDGVGLIFGTGDDVTVDFDGTDFSMTVAGGVQHVATGDYEVAAATFLVTTGGANTVEIDADGALLVNGDAGDDGQVLTSAGAGAPFAWEDAAGGGGGGSLQFVDEAAVTGSAVTSFTISSLDLSTDEEYVIDLMVDNGSGSSANVSMFFNGDTTATNYDRNLSTDGGAGTSTNNAVLANLAAGVVVWYRLIMRLDFDGRVRTLVHGSSNNTSSSVAVTGQHMWRTVSNVTSITISSSVATSISVGSYIRVWKQLRVTGSGSPTDVSAVQLADLVITSNATFQDTDVTVPLTAGTWLVTFDVMQTQDATPDMQTELTYTGTVTSIAGIVFRQRGNGTAQSIGAISALPYQTTETTTDSVFRRGSFRITVSDSGSLKWRVRQDTSSGTSVTWHGGSSMRATKIA